MAAQAQADSGRIQREEAELAALNKELELDLIQAGLDVAGVFDPSPTSDFASATISMARGDYIGAGLSFISCIPYLRDLVAKGPKAVILALKINRLKKRIEVAIAALKLAKKVKSLARRRAAAAVRAKRAAAKAKEIAECEKNPQCRQLTSGRFGANSPTEGKNGSWRGGEKGTSDWHPDPNTDTGREVLEITGGKPVRFNEGYPDFSPYVYKKGNVSGQVEIDMKGNRTTDMTDARDAMREKLGDPTWPGPGRNAPEGWVWHHKEDGVTMELIPQELHDGVRHTGGASIAKEIADDPGY